MCDLENFLPQMAFTNSRRTLRRQLAERVLTEIFYRCDTDLEDDEGIDFEDLLEEALVLIRCRKRLADFIEEKESTWMFTDTRKDQLTAQLNHHSIPPVVLLLTPTTPNILWPFISVTRELTPTVRAVQGSVPVARVDTVQAEKSETLELVPNDNDCGLGSKPLENIFEDLSALFTDCRPVEEEMVEFGVHSISVIRLAEQSSKALRGGSCCFSAEVIDGTRMSATGRVLAMERGFRLGNLLISGRLMKSEDHS